MKINIYDLLFVAFFLFFLFSNLISRIVGHNLNIVFYISWLLLFIYSIKYIKWNMVNFALAVVTIFFILYIVDPRYQLEANLFTIKDFIIPLLTSYIGYSLARNPKNEFIFNHINWLYFIFASYGILQEICFYTFSLDRVLPWDASVLAEMLAAGPCNALQPGGLLRFFGAMNSFVEFQIVVVFLGAFLWLNKENIKRRNLLFLNIVLMFIFLALSLERSPIMMLIILLFFWKIKTILSNYRILFKTFMALCAIFLIIVFNNNSLNSNPLTSGAYQRIYNVVTLNFENDAAIKARKEGQYKESKELAELHYFGIGTGRLSPSAAVSYSSGYIASHNNFIAFYLAYGFLGLLLFCSLLYVGTWRLSYIEPNYRYFGYGMIIAFIAMAMFNMPFIGKQGIIFFMIFGYLNGLKNCTHGIPKEFYRLQQVTDRTRAQG